LGEGSPPHCLDAEKTPHPPSLRDGTLSRRGRGLQHGSLHMNTAFLIQLLVNGLEVGTLYGVFRLSPRAGRGRVASAIRVRGSLHKGTGDRFKNASQVAQHIVVPEPQDAVVVLSKPFVANRVSLAPRVLSTVHLNHKAAFPTDEINSVGSDRLLSDELTPIQSAGAKPVPEHRFRVRGRASQASRTFGLELIGTAHAEAPPHPSRFARRPLPARGERRHYHGMT